MRIFLNSRGFLLLLIFTTLLILTHGKGGRGGGRGGGSRGSSSRGSSSRKTSSGGSTIDRSRDRSRPSDSGRNNPPAPPPKTPEYKPRPSYPSPKPQPKPSAPEQPKQPASNPNYKEQSPNQASSNNQPAQNPNYGQQPPPYSPRERPPPYSPNQPQAPPPPYSPSAGQPGVRQPYPQQPGVAPPPYQPSGGVPSANYPRQPGISTGNNPPQGSYPAGNYPRQPTAGSPNNPQQGGIPGSNYPSQPGVGVGNYPRQPGVASGNYPSQPGVGAGNYPRQPGVASGNYPRQPGVAAGNYPRQPGFNYPQQPLGGNVWKPQSGMPAPAYMNYGGLPTGANMNSQPHKNKGFIGSLMSTGSHKSAKQNKYYGSYPSPYGAGAMGGMGGMGGMHRGGMGGFLGNRGSTAAMYTILPFMAARSLGGGFGGGFFRPRMGFMPMFLPSPFYHHHYGYGQGYGYGYGHTHYDVYNSDYVGRCNRPLTPDNGKVVCNSTRKEVDCDVTCEEGYTFSDNTTHRINKCWHVTGIWKPMKNYPACKPICTEKCLNGGTCASPGKCGCPPDYRGPHCEFYFLTCDIRKLANGVKIKWVCTHSKNGTVCRIKCREPGEFATPPAEEYRCTPEGVWTPNSIPQCISPGETTENAIVNATVISTVTTEKPTEGSTERKK